MSEHGERPRVTYQTLREEKRLHLLNWHQLDVVEWTLPQMDLRHAESHLTDKLEHLPDDLRVDACPTPSVREAFERGPKALRERGEVLRDLIELGITPCPYGSPHSITGDEATRAVIAWDALSSPSEPRVGSFLDLSDAQLEALDRHFETIAPLTEAQKNERRAHLKRAAAFFAPSEPRVVSHPRRIDDVVSAEPRGEPTCERCGGSGKILNENINVDFTCLACGGSGRAAPPAKEDQ